MLSLLISFLSGGPIAPNTLLPFTRITTVSCGSTSGGTCHYLWNRLKPALESISQSMLSCADFSRFAYDVVSS